MSANARKIDALTARVDSIQDRLIEIAELQNQIVTVIKRLSLKNKSGEQNQEPIINLEDIIEDKKEPTNNNER